MKRPTPENTAAEDKAARKRDKKRRLKLQKKLGQSNTDQAVDTSTDADAASPQTAQAETDEIDNLFESKRTEIREAKEAIKEEKKAEEAALKESRKNLKGDHRDIEGLTPGSWVDDGLGGVFNKDGWTGRKDGDGMKIYKAHLMNQSGFGNTKDCPFDCQCCFI